MYVYMYVRMQEIAICTPAITGAAAGQDGALFMMGMLLLTAITSFFLLL